MDYLFLVLESIGIAAFIVAVIFAYMLWYLLYAVKKPALTANPELQRFLLRHCGSLSRNLWPTFWCIESRLQTILTTLIKSSPEVPYEKEFLDFPDGGHAALDWVENDECSVYKKEERPTVIILPGLTGSSEESYARHLVQAVTHKGYRAVVFNNRGQGGADLKTPKTYNGIHLEDLCYVIDHVKERYSDAPLLGAGVSLGGVLITNYVASMGEKSVLIGAMAISSCWDVFEMNKSLEKPLNALVFNKHLTSSLVAGVNRNKDIFENHGIDVAKVRKSRTIREFDDNFTCKQFGYPSHREYYEDATMAKKVCGIRVPYLALNAADDIFAPAHTIPLKKAEQSEHVAFAVTDFGGHIGFLEGLLPIGPNLMDDLLAEFADAIFKHGHELTSQTS